MKRSGFKKPTYERKPAPPVRPLASTPNYGGTTAGPVQKAERRSDTTREAMAHKAKLAALGCVVCRRIHGPHAPAPVELHHLRKDGWGKGDYRTLLPVCAEHHRGALGIHGLGTRGFAKFYGFDQEDLLRDALALIGETP